jgi:hypothetical protein
MQITATSMLVSPRFSSSPPSPPLRQLDTWEIKDGQLVQTSKGTPFPKPEQWSPGEALPGYKKGALIDLGNGQFSDDDGNLA